MKSYAALVASDMERVEGKSRFDSLLEGRVLLQNPARHLYSVISSVSVRGPQTRLLPENSEGQNCGLFDHVIEDEPDKTETRGVVSRMLFPKVASQHPETLQRPWTLWVGGAHMLSVGWLDWTKGGSPLRHRGRGVQPCAWAKVPEHASISWEEVMQQSQRALCSKRAQDREAWRHVVEKQHRIHARRGVAQWQSVSALGTRRFENAADPHFSVVRHHSALEAPSLQDEPIRQTARAAQQCESRQNICQRLASGGPFADNVLRRSHRSNRWCGS